MLSMVSPRSLAVEDRRGTNPSTLKARTRNDMRKIHEPRPEIVAAESFVLKRCSIPPFAAIAAKSPRCLLPTSSNSVPPAKSGHATPSSNCSQPRTTRRPPSKTLPAIPSRLMSCWSPTAPCASTPHPEAAKPHSAVPSGSGKPQPELNLRHGLFGSTREPARSERSEPGKSTVDDPNLPWPFGPRTNRKRGFRPSCKSLLFLIPET